MNNITWKSQEQIDLETNKPKEPTIAERLAQAEADNEILKLMVADLGLMVGGGL